MEPQSDRHALAPKKSEMVIAQDDMSRPDVTALLEAHFTALIASTNSNKRVLDLSALRHPSITIFTARGTTSNELIGCTALKQISPSRGELKSMRTAANHRRKGVAAALLEHILGVAKDRGYKKLVLETGAADEFAPARALYSRYGFVTCDSLEGYEDLTSAIMSVFMIYDIN